MNSSDYENKPAYTNPMGGGRERLSMKPGSRKPHGGKDRRTERSQAPKRSGGSRPRKIVGHEAALTKFRDEKTPVALKVMMGGVDRNCQVLDFDKYAIYFLTESGETMWVFKHAIMSMGAEAGAA